MSLVLIVIGCAILAGIFRTYVHPKVGDTVLGAMIFAPALLYYIEDKNVAEIALLGFSAKFDDASAQSVQAAFEGGVENIVIRSLVDDDPDFERSAYFEECADYFTLRVEQVDAMPPEEKDRHVVLSSSAIGSSLACGRLSGVIVLAQDGTYVGTYDASFFREALALWVIERETPSFTDAADWIRQYTIFGTALGAPRARIRPGEGYREALIETATLLEAFDRFEAIDGDILVTTDVYGAFKGIIKRDTVERTLLGAAIDALGHKD